MFSIGEFSKITGLSVKTLFYHEKRLIVPAAVDPGSGYRQYDERNIDRARIIVSLRSLEFSLDDIAEILAACSDDEDILSYLERQKKQLAEQIKRLGGVVEQLDQIIRQEQQSREEQNMSTKSDEVTERELDSILIAGIRMQGRHSDCGTGLRRLASAQRLAIAGKPLCLCYDDEYRETDANFEPCMPIRREVKIEGIHVRQLPGGRCVA